VLFALTLLGVALFHHHTLKVALVGAVVITLYQLFFTGFKTAAGMPGLLGHVAHEWVTLANLLGLLLGFALLADHFERSHLPDKLPRYLPNDWKGGFVLLVGVFLLSGILDNIAAAMIGGTMAGVVFKKRVHIGYLAAIVAASNGGGAGSVVGDTTTTMMWIAGANPVWVLEAYVGGAVAILIFGTIAARQQHAYQPIQKGVTSDKPVDTMRLAIVVIILLAAIGANVWCNLNAPALLGAFPVIGTAVLLAVLVTAPMRSPTWGLLPGAFKGSIFLLALVWCASLMPVQHLPQASWPTALGLGFVSAVFDNIPLTALAIRQDGYDWGFLAFAVGFGGSMTWFGSSAGVALTNMYPEARSVWAWLKAGWHIALAYVAGFFVMLAVLGWNPHSINERGTAATKGVTTATKGGTTTTKTPPAGAPSTPPVRTTP
jgi:Na+/H+ antiporter NhaD/arsenite permease-like protein